MFDKLCQLTNDSVKIRHNTVEKMRALKSVGHQTEAAVNQAEVYYYNVKASLTELENQIVQVQNALSLLLNQTPQQIEREQIKNVKFLGDFIVKEISLVALSNRPDARLAEAKLSSCFYGVNIGRCAFFNGTGA